MTFFEKALKYHPPNPLPVIDGFAIVDGHAHTYMDDLAGKIISTFTELHMMEPTASLGKGTFGDLTRRMGENGIDLTVTANFGPVKAVDKINRWNLKKADELGCIIPLVSVYPGMSSDALESLAVMGAKGIKMHNGIRSSTPATPPSTMCTRYVPDSDFPSPSTAGRYQDIISTTSPTNTT